MASIVVINNERKEEVELAADAHIFMRNLREIGFSDDEIFNKKISVEECNTGIEYVDKIVDKLKRISIVHLDYLYKYSKNLSEDEIKLYNAIVKYEYERGNIKDVKELVNILFEKDCYMYVDGISNINELASKLLVNNKEIKKLTLNDAIDILEIFNKRWNGMFDEYNGESGYVGCCKREQIEKRKEINEYKFRDWDGNVTIFKTDIITALGIAVFGQGTLFKDKELLFTVELGYYDLIDVYNNLIGRDPIKVRSYEASEEFGIIPATLGDDRVLEYELVIAGMEEEEEIDE